MSDIESAPENEYRSPVEVVLNNLQFQLNKLTTLSESLTNILVRKHSLNNEVELVVGNGGMLLDINIAPQAADLTDGRLSSVIVETYREALVDSMREKTIQLEKYYGDIPGTSSTN